MKHALLLGVILFLTACGSLGEKQSTILGKNVPGISDLDTISAEDRENQAWWEKYYGN